MTIIRTDASTIEASGHLEAFALGARQTLALLFGAEPAMSAFRQMAPEARSEHAVAVVVGFAGDMRGQALIGMRESDARALASRLIMMPVEALDALAESAIAEIGNMVAGSCATCLAEQGLRLDITTPTVITGDAVRVGMPHMVRWEITFELPFAALSLTLGLTP